MSTYCAHLLRPPTALLLCYYRTTAALLLNRAGHRIRSTPGGLIPQPDLDHSGRLAGDRADVDLVEAGEIALLVRKQHIQGNPIGWCGIQIPEMISFFAQVAFAGHQTV